MGADGGTIPKRCELIRNKKKKEKIEKNVTAATKWRTCQLTQLPLQKPIVASIVEAKLSKSLALNETTKHIKSITDVKELILTDNKSFNNDAPEKSDKYMDFNETPFVCPVTSIGMNGTNVFLVNWNCGCVVSEKAIKEVKSDACHGCGGSFSMEQLIQLYPSPETFKLYQERIKNECLQKKNKKSEAKTTNLAIQNIDEPTHSKTTGNKIVKATNRPTLDKKRKHIESTIQDDPNVSKALKSIFTSSEAAKNQPQGHWVTHNPLYF